MEVKILFNGEEYCEFQKKEGKWIDEDGDRPKFQSVLNELEKGIRAEPWFDTFVDKKK